MTNTGFEVLPFPKIRRLMEDGGRLGREKHLVHGLFEMDVTEARQAIRAYRAHTGESLSFMAFVVACVGRAVEQHKPVQACRAWGEKLVLFDDVDVNTMFEVEADGQKIIRPHILRAVNKKVRARFTPKFKPSRTTRKAVKPGSLSGSFCYLASCGVSFYGCCSETRTG